MNADTIKLGKSSRRITTGNNPRIRKLIMDRATNMVREKIGEQFGELVAGLNYRDELFCELNDYAQSLIAQKIEEAAEHLVDEIDLDNIMDGITEDDVEIMAMSAITL